MAVDRADVKRNALDDSGQKSRSTPVVRVASSFRERVWMGISSFGGAGALRGLLIAGVRSRKGENYGGSY